MTEFWQSQPRKFCEFCNCWIADNKSSRQFHENGKNHQNNVTLKLNELRKKGQKDAAKKLADDNSMKQMEQAALRAFKKDMEQNPALAAQYGVKVKENEQTCAQKPADFVDETPAAPEANPAKGTWLAEQTPEGYTYYWNDVTSEMTWIKPADFQRTDAAKNSTVTQIKESSVAKEKVTKEKKIKSKKSITEAKSLVEIVTGTTSSDARNIHPSAYGNWQRLQPDEKPVDLQLPTTKTVENAEEKPIAVAAQPKIKFREKKVDTLGSEFVAFKKRKLAASQARNAKQKDNTD